MPESVEFFAEYHLADETVRFLYSVRKLCRETDNCECVVPGDTVLEVIVEPRAKPKFSTLAINRSKLDRVVNAENVDHVAYCDFDAGVIYNVSEHDGTILFWQYARSAQDCNAITKKR